MTKIKGIITPTAKNAVKNVETAEKKVSTKKNDAKKKIIENLEHEATDEAKERVLKYIYPDNCKTKADKKEFRRKARAAVKAYEKRIAQLSASKSETDKKALQQERDAYQQWKKNNLS